MMTAYHTVLELDDLYYQRYQEGASLQELKNIRIQQEEKLNTLPVLLRQRVAQQIAERYYATLCTPAAKEILKT